MNLAKQALTLFCCPQLKMPTVVYPAEKDLTFLDMREVCRIFGAETSCHSAPTTLYHAIFACKKTCRHSTPKSPLFCLISARLPLAPAFFHTIAIDRHKAGGEYANT
jgi:hypothetical protein